MYFIGGNIFILVYSQSVFGNFVPYGQVTNLLTIFCWYMCYIWALYYICYIRELY